MDEMEQSLKALLDATIRKTNVSKVIEDGLKTLQTTLTELREKHEEAVYKANLAYYESTFKHKERKRRCPLTSGRRRKWRR